MVREGGNPASPQKSILEVIKELSTKYGNIDSVPENELAKLGYERYAPGSIRSIEAHRKAEAAGLLHAQRLEKKFANRPFDTVLVKMEVKGVQGRKLGEAESLKLQKMIDSAKDFFDEDPMIFRDLPEEFFLGESELINFLKGSTEISFADEVAGDLYTWKRYVSIRDKVESEFSELDLRLDYDGTNLSSKNALLVYQDLERLKGRLADPTEIEKSFNDSLQDSVIEHQKVMEQEESEELIAYATKNNIRNYFELSLRLFSGMLASNGIVEMADNLSKAKSLEEARSVLRNNVDVLPQDLFGEEQRLKREIKNAPVEEKKKLSGRLKEIQEFRHSRKRIVAAVMSYYDFAEMAANQIIVSIKNIQDFIIRKSGDESQDIALIGTPDADLDKDPGAMSGDCTEGKPLPFDDPDMPVFNIKVKKGEKHIGNIYLLETIDTKKEKVWHLDAIQIPLAANWDNSIEALFESMGREAEKKGVKYITVSRKSFNISNYDYISRAVKRYINNKGLGEIRVKIPKVEGSSKRSEFQGGGQDYIVWQATAIAK